MESRSQPMGSTVIQRWGGLLAAILFAAATVAYVVEGASGGSVILSGSLAFVFGAWGWRLWRSGR